MPTDMEHTQNLSNRGALLCELVVNRSVPALDALTHTQEFFVVTPASSVQVALPSACIDGLFQLALTMCQSPGKNQKCKITYGKERDEFSKSLVARFDSQSVGLRPHERSDDTLLANLEDGLCGIFESPGI